MTDPFDSNQWHNYAKRVQDELVPKIDASAVVMSLVTGNVDIKFAVELGLSIMMDKPIIAVVLPGAEVPDKLVRVCDEIVEGSVDDPSTSARIYEAMQRLRP